MEAYDDIQVEVGSPLALGDFLGWCKGHVTAAVAHMQIPKFLFADGPRHAVPVAVVWELEGQPDDTEEFLTHVIPHWASDAEASQVAVSLPIGGEEPAALLVAADETGVLARQARVVLGDRGLELEDWLSAPVTHLPRTEWQQLLARAAGWREYTKWRCRRCRSVCSGEADVIPTPCDFCASVDIERVPLTTPLAPPVDEAITAPRQQPLIRRALATLRSPLPWPK